MSTKKELAARPLVYNRGIWLLTNCGCPRDIHFTRKLAIESAEQQAGKPWSECRKYFEVRKVHIIEGWP